MAGTLEMELQEQSTGVYPPSFCNWRLLLAVMIITELAVVLVGLGRGACRAGNGWAWQLSTRSGWHCFVLPGSASPVAGPADFPHGAHGSGVG